MNANHVYTTADGRDLPIPADILETAKFTKTGKPDRRAKGNEAFIAWAEAMETSGQSSPAGVVEGADVEAQQTGNTFVTWDSIAKQPEVAASEAAQLYAMRVWNGQSPDTLARNERVRRVAAALEGQGWTMEGIELPQ